MYRVMGFRDQISYFNILSCLVLKTCHTSYKNKHLLVVNLKKTLWKISNTQKSRKNDKMSTLNTG